LHSVGYDDQLAGHVTAVQDDGTLLVNPFELTWDEVTASDVVVIDRDGNKLEGRYNVNPAVELHLALRRKRPDLGVVIHNHPRWANVWAGTGRVPPIYDQTSAQVGAELVVVDEYGGQFDGVDSSERAVELFGDAEWALLVNHGVLITAPTIARAFLRAYTLEWRARRAFEIETLGGGRPVDMAVATQFGLRFDELGAPHWWEAARRRTLRRDPGVLG
jgi:ribulose-5-phosphate 4-epimerase/fuculose-1-phosphate aldolase